MNAASSWSNFPIEFVLFGGVVVLLMAVITAFILAGLLSRAYRPLLTQTESLDPELENRVKAKGKRWRRVILIISGAIMLLALLWVSYVALQVESVGRRDDARPADAIVVLTTDQEGGWPSPPFAARLDHARSLYEEGIAPLVVVAGGNPEGEAHTEAEAGVNYLEYYDLPSDVLLTVGGNNTYQSLQEIEQLEQREGWKSIVLVSEPFHMFRSLAMARELGLRAYGSPTNTSPTEQNPVWGSYFILREVAAYTTYLLGFRSPTHHFDPLRLILLIRENQGNFPIEFLLLAGVGTVLTAVITALILIALLGRWRR